MYDDIEDTHALSIEAQVALLMGDEDAEELAAETPAWRMGGKRAKTFEPDRLDFDTPSVPNSERSN